MTHYFSLDRTKHSPNDLMTQHGNVSEHAIEGLSPRPPERHIFPFVTSQDSTKGVVYHKHSHLGCHQIP